MPLLLYTTTSLERLSPNSKIRQTKDGNMDVRRVLISLVNIIILIIALLLVEEPLPVGEA